MKHGFSIFRCRYLLICHSRYGVGGTYCFAQIVEFRNIWIVHQHQLISLPIYKYRRGNPAIALAYIISRFKAAFRIAAFLLHFLHYALSKFECTHIALFPEHGWSMYLTSVLYISTNITYLSALNSLIKILGNRGRDVKSISCCKWRN